MSPAEGPTDLHRGGSGPPLVLLHGINASWRVWQPVLELLERRFTVYALTMPGHRGGPTLAPGAVDVAALADAVAARLAELGLERPHLAGNSLGGWVSLERGKGFQNQSIKHLEST